MKKILNFGLIAGMLTVGLIASDSFAAAKRTTTKKQSAIQGGTKVRTKTEAAGIYDQDCYDKYYSCMDQFCIADNEDGGSCSCSDDSLALESELDRIKQMLSEAERISTEEVEKVKAGANADIIFNGSRSYDEKGNVKALNATKDKAEAKKSMWSSLYEDSDEEESELDEDGLDIFSLKGGELYNAANDLCKEQ